MIKIHAGKFKNHRIKRVGIETTKETASMVREAVFNMLYNIEGNVLDLFAGSGSYGITAFSLGAREVTFVDNNLKAFKTINDNLNKLNIKGLVYKEDYQSFLNKKDIKYDLIFLDPPFNFKNYESLLSLCVTHLNINGKIVLEINKDTKVTNNDLNIISEKKYGSKKIIIYNI